MFNPPITAASNIQSCPHTTHLFLFLSNVSKEEEEEDLEETQVVIQDK